MSWGIVAGAVISIGSQVAAGSAQKAGSKKAERAQQAALGKTMGVQQDVYDTMKGYQQPYAESGGKSVDPLMGLLMGDRGVMDNPLAQAQQTSGLDMLRQRFGGNLSSGVETGFKGRLGSMEESAQRNRQGGMVDVGMGGTSGLAGFGQTRANALSNAMVQSSQVSQQAQQGRSNINQQMFGNAAYTMGQMPSMIAMNNYLQEQNQMFGG